MAGQTSTFWWVTCKKPLVPTTVLPNLFCRARAKTRTERGSCLQACWYGCPHSYLSGKYVLWCAALPLPWLHCEGENILHPRSYNPYPATHIPHPVVSYVLHLTPAPCIPHPTWDPVERGLGPLPFSTGCTPWVLGKLEGSQGALITGCPAWISKVTTKAMVTSVKERTLQWHCLQLSSQPCASSEEKPWVGGGGSIHGVHPAWPSEPRTGMCLLHKPGCEQEPESAPGFPHCRQGSGNLGCKVPPRAASLFVGSWEENPSKLRRRKGVPKTELQSRKAISTLLKSLEFLSRENKKQSVNLQLKSLPKSVNNFHIQRIYFSLGFQCKVIQLRKVGPLYCCSQIHMHLFCWKFDIGHFLYSHLSLAKK